MDALPTEFQTYTTEFSGALSRAFGMIGAHADFSIFATDNIYPPPDTPPEQDEADGDDHNTQGNSFLPLPSNEDIVYFKVWGYWFICIN